MAMTKGQLHWKWQEEGNAPPTPYEVRRGREIGKRSHTEQGCPFIWYPCPRCNKYRWIRYRRKAQQPYSPQSLCLPCRSTVNNHNRNPLGKLVDPEGYVQVRVDASSLLTSMVKRNGWIAEHRLVMAQYLGRPLNSSEIVHHRNGIKDDNRLENLRIITSTSVHRRLENYKCPNCILRQEIRMLRWENKQVRAELERLGMSLQAKLGE